MSDDEDDNAEAVQAHLYPRAFVTSGPVVKVYSKGEDKLSFDMKLPVLKNEDQEVIRPSNLMLHQGESQMIFSDSRDPTQLFNFDLETGKIVE